MFFEWSAFAFFLWSRLQADVYDDGMRASHNFFLSFFFLPLLFASLASCANHTHPIMTATPGVCCINTSEFEIFSPGLLLALWGKMGCVSFLRCLRCLFARCWKGLCHLYSDAHDLLHIFSV